MSALPQYNTIFFGAKFNCYEFICALASRAEYALFLNCKLWEFMVYAKRFMAPASAVW